MKQTQRLRRLADTFGAVGAQLEQARRETGSSLRSWTEGMRLRIQEIKDAEDIAAFEAHLGWRIPQDYWAEFAAWQTSRS